VRLGRRFVLVGVSPDRIEPLCDIASPDEVADIARMLVPQGSTLGDGNRSPTLEGWGTHAKTETEKAAAFDDDLSAEASRYEDTAAGSSVPAARRQLGRLLRRLSNPVET